MARAPAARLAAAVVVLAVLGCACVAGSPAATLERPAPAPRAAPPVGPVVEQAPRVAAPPPDPDAAPTTPLGELRAAYLPVWSPEFDWAFPPEVCGTDWALDAVARADPDASPAVLGDPVAAAALSVMRYRHLLSRALAEPDPLGQLCVAVGSVGAARAEALELLASLVAAGARSAEPPAYPDDVTVVAASPTAVLAVACVAGGPDGPAGTGSGAARLEAYLLALSRGLEDAVTDISYRVSDVTSRSAEGCHELDSWTAEWDRQATQWTGEGQIWTTLARTVTVEELCEAPPPDGPDECPRDWKP